MHLGMCERTSLSKRVRELLGTARLTPTESRAGGGRGRADGRRWADGSGVSGEGVGLDGGSLWAFASPKTPRTASRPLQRPSAPPGQSSGSGTARSGRGRSSARTATLCSRYGTAPSPSATALAMPCRGTSSGHSRKRWQICRVLSGRLRHRNGLRRCSAPGSRKSSTSRPR